LGHQSICAIDTVNSFDVHRLRLKGIQDKSAHSHVCVISRASELLAQSLAEAQRELRDFLPLPYWAVASMMNAEEIPNWVPATVKKLAVRLSGFDDELVRRLVTDPKMKNVCAGRNRWVPKLPIQNRAWNSAWNPRA
jgi:hypothetical protein